MLPLLLQSILQVATATTTTSSWIPPTLDTPDAHRCDFDVVHADQLSPKDFVRLYSKKNRPALIKGAAKSWLATTKWTKEFLREQLQDVEINGATNGIQGILNDREWSDKTLTYWKSSAKLMEFISATPYIFAPLDEDGSLLLGPKFSVLDDVATRDKNFYFSHWYDLEGSQVNHFFILGGENSGLSLHSHEEAWNGLIVGIKRWFMLPGIERGPPPMPDERELDVNVDVVVDVVVDVDVGTVGFVGTMGTEEETWNDGTKQERKKILHDIEEMEKNENSFELKKKGKEKTKKRRRKPFQCYQHAGDVMYVPNFYQHTVYNIGETVAVSAVHLPFIQTGVGA
jgi:hypothetical protein